MDKETNDDQIKVKKEVYPQIYAYIHPEIPSDEDWVKIGYTERKDATIRIKEQNETAAGKFKYETLWIHPSKYKYKDEMFKDHELHNFLQKVQGRQRRPKTEWFNYENLELKRESERDFNKFANEDFTQDEVLNINDYYLRDEQNQAIEKTINYFKNHHNGEFLWNAKPRFGKTLTTLDLITRLDAERTLIVTNRPAVADSWFSDYKKFIKGKSDFLFVSHNDNIKNETYSYKEFCKQAQLENGTNKMIAFVSLQDLKGSKPFGGTHEKNYWLKDTDWDILVIDECHEGVDTLKTDIAFKQLKRKNTLHLSGTPFRALESGNFSEDAIFSWTYADEQNAKENWSTEEGNNNPYADLPRINMLTYQMGNIIYDDDNKPSFDDDNPENESISFDLNEFFATTGKGNDIRFKHKREVIKWLETLFSSLHYKYPFSTFERQDQLNHTFWILDRVDSAKCLEAQMKEMTNFRNYKIVNVAGDSRDEEAESSRALNRVREAIANNERTITLSAGRLSTGVTVEQWSGVMILSNMKSASLYMQSAFRAQNPCIYKENGTFKRKENCYVFDFSPARTLETYDNFANGLNAITADVTGTEEERKKNIRELLNFFPVIAENEEGEMTEINESQVLSLPKTIKAKEVVEHGFMCNMLFTDAISGLFKNKEAIQIINKFDYYEQQKIVNNNDVDSDIDGIDENGEVYVPQTLIINESKEINEAPEYKRYIQILDNVKDNNTDADKKIELVKQSLNGIKSNEKVQEIAKDNNVKPKQLKKILDRHIDEKIDIIEKTAKVHEIQINDLIHKRDEEMKKAKDKSDALKIQFKFDDKLQELKDKQTGELIEQAHEFREAIQNEALKEILANKPNEAKKEQEENIRGRLRGFARTIPAFLMAYGDETTCLSNFDEIVSNEVFQEVTNITLDQFRELRDKFQVFDKKVFDQSCRTFMNYRKKFANYFDEAGTKDIFSYIPPQSNNQIFTPRKVVNMMLDSLEEEYPDIFSNPDLKFCDLYVKSGLYLTGIIKRLYAGLRDKIPDDKARIKHIIEKQIYGFAPSDIIYNIAKNYIFGFDEDSKNLNTSNLVNLDTIPYAKGVANVLFEEKIKEIFGENMKFDVIVGNPPYQEETKDTSDNPIYHYFYTLAMNTSRIACLVSPGRFLFRAGKTPKDWNENMLNSEHVKIVDYNQNPEIYFKNTDIKGGVAVLLYDQAKKFEPIELFIPFKELRSIKNKVIKKNNFRSIKEIIYLQNKFNLEELYRLHPEYKDIIGSGGTEKRLTTPIFSQLDIFTEQKKNDEDIRIFGLIKNKRTYRWLNSKFLEKHPNLEKYKVFLPKSNGSGAIGEELSTPLVGEPLVGYTFSFIAFGAFDDSYEASNCLKYLKTRFARTLLGILKITQDNLPEKWTFVPLQDFTENSDIDWSKSIPEIDQQLYKKYNLDESEIAFIEEKIKAME